MKPKEAPSTARSAIRRDTCVDEKLNSDKSHLTTTELARLCGVSRFTILNWINQGKIRAVRTVGGHYRIPAAAAIGFLEAFHLDVFHNKKEAAVSSALGHCWEYPQKTSCDNQCRDCLIHGREIDYCFVVVRQFGKEVIKCKGDCLSCAYFEEFFGFDEERLEQAEPSDGQGLVTAEEKQNVLQSFVRGVGRGVHGPRRDSGADSPGKTPRGT